MSVADSAVPRNGHEIKNQVSTSLNDALREALRRVEGIMNRDHLIVRCEELPRVNGNPEELKEVFDTLVHAIFASASRSKLFLHVGCTEIHLDDLQPATMNMNRYQVKIQTNISAGKGWKDEHKTAFDRCQQILSKLDGTLSVNPVTNAGCLFTLTVPGKFE